MAGTPLNVTEWMKGYIGFGATDYDGGFIQGIDQGISFMHEVLIQMDDIDRFVSEPTHEARMDGYIQCDALGGKRPVVNGTFNMLVEDSRPGLKIMLYRLPFTDGNGAPKTMLAHKTIHNDRALDLWGDITTLYMRIFDGDVPGPDMRVSSVAGNPPSAAPIAMGVLHIEKADGFRSARSFQSPGQSSIVAAAAATKFGLFYMDELWKIFGPALQVGT